MPRTHAIYFADRLSKPAILVPLLYWRDNLCVTRVGRQYNEPLPLSISLHLFCAPRVNTCADDYYQGRHHHEKYLLVQ